MKVKHTKKVPNLFQDLTAIAPAGGSELSTFNFQLSTAAAVER
jgi:hypothetical protein